MDQFLDLLFFLIPAYLANSSPVVLGGGPPLDFNITLPDGRRMLGDSKTIRGFAGGVLAGTVAGGVLAVYPLPYFSGPEQQFFAGFLLSLGTMAGDSFGSFLKRRMGFPPGKPFWLDTVLFLLFALLLVYPVARPALYQPVNLLVFVLLTAVLHPLTNAVANRIGLKKVPW
ncbi:CDP-2,3-bis-(O-geranylgeranyl)-sn-glycerol synthase [Candidatus Micrarchaeota archaeon]|nr:CDP-2,3-bis-(O-geranylgeranyl)-sn-glycerol synthase [Candidatus Micrarchaeota archaeon]